ncbi:MAG: hypothetical protein GFH25_541200n13 [Chloroflexi bacterium AL-N10]|nr:hypothetical protein [Chloroflexi bacterium AL-N1]NOK68834.1 hypothetical protein [Chloroflexi bacterium AL-N10]NOK76818.1 hypothetical protein [Chloroflexi bacterium AL-N5]NOK90675.1 hypothetical protein [Chloroflexi bacterium AL-N15]
MRPNGIITLTTDFGHTDSYVGVMKGVILNIAPEARMIDITHHIDPQNIPEATYTLHTFHRYFPVGTVHLVIVDPGVGGTRRPVALQTPEAFYVAPDNGVLTSVWRDALQRWDPEQCDMVDLTERRFWLSEVSNTFHGRDIFAPVAAHIVNGTALTEFGSRITQLTEADVVEPVNGRTGALVGRIVHVDHFGNCITNIELSHLEQSNLIQGLTVEIIGQHIPGLYRTYADGPLGELIALIGSSGRLELAIRNSNAAKRLGVGVNDNLRVWAVAHTKA